MKRSAGAEASVRGDLRVLVVEDHPRDAELAVGALRGSFDTVSAERVETASKLTQALASEPWDVVLSDYQLPQLDGFGALSIVRAAGGDLPFIVVSGVIDVETAVALLKAGANDYVMKDHLERLAEVVRSELAAAALRRVRREAESEIRATLYGIGDGVLATDAAGLVTRLNPVAERLLGWSEAEACGQPIGEVFRIVNRDTRAVVENPVTRVLRHEEITELADRTLLIARDGSERPIADSGAPILDAQGELTGVALVFRDETDRLAAEVALQEREAFGRAVLNAVGVAIAVVDRQAVITAVNRSWEKFARDNGDLPGGVATGIGANYLAVTRAAGAEVEGAAEAAAGLQAILDGQSAEYSLEYPCHEPDGARRWFLLRATPLGGEQGGAVVAHVDITDRKLLDVRRELATDVLATLNRTNDVGQLVGDVLGLIQAESDLEAIGLRLRDGDDYPYFDSRGFSTAFLKSERQLCARDASGEILRDATGRAALECMCGNILCGRTLADRPYFTPHGSFWTNFASDLVASAGGESEPLLTRLGCSEEGHESMALIPLRAGDAVIGLLHLADRRPNRLTLDRIEFLEGIGASIGIALLRRRAREQATAATAELERLLAEAEQSRRVLLSVMEDQKRGEAARLELQEQLAQQQRLEVVGQLAAGIAHDFNNILTGITGYTELAIEEVPPESPMRDDLAQVVALAGRAADLTRQLLAFSRRQTLSPVVLDLNGLLGNLTKMLGRLIGEQIELRFVPGQGLGLVKADPGQLEQVLMNLAINARDAMPDGGTLTIATVDMALDEHAAQQCPGTDPGPSVLLTVTDTGRGMAEAVRDRVFEPFYTTKEVGEGTGLGLATAYGIVKQHGGQIWVDSEPGQGATFSVCLPREAAPVEVPALSRPPELATGTETILVTEDEPAVLQIVRKTLERCGYRVLRAGLPSEALEVMSQHGPEIDLLLTDVVMPELNGCQLYQEALAVQPRLRVLYMSGYTDDAFVNQDPRDTEMAFIHKPFTSAQLANAVRDVLDRPAVG